MPIPKRWFHVSQDINGDPELWQFTNEFGDRALRTWLQILVYLDRSGNQWRTSGDWLATLSRTVRQSAANVSRQIRWMVAKGWLRVCETAADGSPLLLDAPNWSKYNRTQEHKRVLMNPDKGTDGDPLLSFPNLSFPSLTLPKKKEGVASSLSKPASSIKQARTQQLADDAFIVSLKGNPAYKHLDLAAEQGKAQAWLAVNPQRQFTKRFFVSWLNRAHPPPGASKGESIMAQHLRTLNEMGEEL